MAFKTKHPFQAATILLMLCLAGVNTPVEAIADTGFFRWRTHGFAEVEVDKVDPAPRMAPDVSKMVTLDSGGISNTLRPLVFAPTQNVVLTRVEVSLSSMPDAFWLGGDICLFTNSNTDVAPTPVICQGAKLATGARSFQWILDFPVPIFMPDRSSLSCTAGLSRRSPQNRFIPSELNQAAFECKIHYSTLDELPASTPLGKVLRIPYLDSARSGTELILQKPFYTGRTGDPLRIWGYTSFYLPAGTPFDHDINTCIKTTDGEVTDCVNNHFDFSGPLSEFQTRSKGFSSPIVLERGLGLLGSCQVTAPAAVTGDCVIYAFAEIGRTRPVSLSSLFQANAHVNPGFLTHQYCEAELVDMLDRTDGKHFTLMGNLQLAKLAREIFPSLMSDDDLLAAWHSLDLQSKKQTCRRLFTPIP